MTTPLQRFFVAIVMLGLLPTACVAAVPFAPYGTANGDAQLNLTDRLFGPYSLPTPMPTDNGTVSQYYVCTTGGIFFKSFSSAGLVYTYKNYSNTYGPMIGAATAHMHNAANGYYHRTISGPGAALDALWSDVLPGGIPIVPTAGLVFTVDNSYLYYNSVTTSLVEAQTIVLWNSTSTLMLFRIKSIAYTTTAVVSYGGYLGPSASYLIPGVATTWASSSNTGVNGLYTVLMNLPVQAPQPSKTAAPSRTATGPTPSISHSQSLSPTASISVSLTKLTPSLSLSPTSSSKSFSKTLLPSATAESPSLSVSQSPSLSKSLSHTVAQSASEGISESSSMSLSKTIPSSLTAQSPSHSATHSESSISFSTSPSVTASPNITSTRTLHRTLSNSSSPSRSGPTKSSSASHSRTLRVSPSPSRSPPTASHSLSSSDKYEADGAGWQTVVMIAVPGIAGLAIVLGAILAVKHVSAGVTMTSAAAGAAGSLPPPPPPSSSLPF